jgi:hypothetical protein
MLIKLFHLLSKCLVINIYLLYVVDNSTNKNIFDLKNKRIYRVLP